MQRAEQARTDKNVPAACDLYQRALTLKPNWPDGWWYLGNLLFVAQRYAAAEDALRHFTDLRSDLAEGWGMRGLAAVQSQSYENALQFLGRGLSLPFSAIPDMKPVIETNHAFLLSRVGRFDDALEALRPFVHKDPDPDLLNALGIAALQRKLMPSEVPSQDRSLTEGAGRVEYEFLTGDPAALASAQELTKRYPSAPGVHFLAGMIYFAKQPARAKVEFLDELHMNPDDAATKSMLAYTQFALHQVTPTAVGEAREAVAVQPSNAGYEYVLGILEDAEGDTAAAVQSLRTATELKPSNVEYHVALAVEYNKVNKFAQADQERRRALDLKFGHAAG